MDNNIVKFPRETDDRRRRARSRQGYQDRRRDFRYQAEFPVTIYIGSGDSQRTYKGVAENISDGGLLRKNSEIPEAEERIRVRFKMLINKHTAPLYAGLFLQGERNQVAESALGQGILVGEQTVITSQGQLSGAMTGGADKRGAKLPG